MQLVELSLIKSGAKVYFRPAGLMASGHATASEFLSDRSTGMQYAGGILYVCAPDGSVQTGYFSIEELTQQLNGLPTDVRDSLFLQLDNIRRVRTPVMLGGNETLTFTKPLIMGVLNVTPDSFSDGGRYIDPDLAVCRARAMIAEGADIIDIGGESTRPGATPVVDSEEIDRVVPVIERLVAEKVVLSIDTRRASVMTAALAAGAHIINDVSALTFDPDSLGVAAKSGAPVMLMHAQGDPRTMQDDPYYDHVLLDIYDYLEQRIAVCKNAGIAQEKIIVDPGLGFGKRVVRDNLALIDGLSLFKSLGCPILVGASRKRFIGAITGIENAEERVTSSVAVAIMTAEQGADILRVHDVKETSEALKVVNALRDFAILDVGN
jgi:dihydropteroate synthase